MPSFVAIDVETANPDLSSICQIGIARFEKGVPTERWVSLIDPADYFCPSCIHVHGILPEDVLGQPRISDVYAKIISQVSDHVVVAHTGFDRSSLGKAFARSGLEMPQWRWLDSARVARRAWPEVAQKGYGLANLAARLGIRFKHHDALEDAIAAGTVLVYAITESGQDLDWWIRRVKRRIDPTKGAILPISESNPDGHLVGETVVFTGALSMPRAVVEQAAMSVGCTVAKTVNKRVTLLVVGDQDITKLVGHAKSSKHRRAEELIGQGQSLRIVGESDFMALIDEQSGAMIESERE